MTSRKLTNVTFLRDEYFEPFSVDRYTFFSNRSLNQEASGVRVYDKKEAWDHRQHKQNAYVKYSIQEPSILFRGGRVGNRRKSIQRKLLEDLLVLGSLLTSRNWQLYSRRNHPQFPAVSSNHLEHISKDSKQCKKYLNTALTKLKDPAWQTQFDSGFHLRMLLNHSNILNTESRFLAMVVIWEWLYPHLKNPKGATPSDESNNLVKIFSFILKQFWPSEFNPILAKSNIFHVLRNQLAHSGKLPINRKYAEPWMTQIPWDHEYHNQGVID